MSFIIYRHCKSCSTVSKRLKINVQREIYLPIKIKASREIRSVEGFLSSNVIDSEVYNLNSYFGILHFATNSRECFRAGYSADSSISPA